MVSSVPVGAIIPVIGIPVELSEIRKVHHITLFLLLEIRPGQFFSQSPRGNSGTIPEIH